MKRPPLVAAPLPASAADSPTLSTASRPDWLALTVRYVSELQYGQVTLTIHQGRVIEVQKTERTRLDRPG